MKNNKEYKINYLFKVSQILFLISALTWIYILVNRSNLISNSKESLIAFLFGFGNIFLALFFQTIVFIKTNIFNHNNNINYFLYHSKRGIGSSNFIKAQRINLILGFVSAFIYLVILTYSLSNFFKINI